MNKLRMIYQDALREVSSLNLIIRSINPIFSHILSIMGLRQYNTKLLQVGQNPKHLPSSISNISSFLNFPSLGKVSVVWMMILVSGMWNVGMGQIVFTDDFSSNQSTTYTTSGTIGVSAWSITRSGADFGGRRNTSPGQLELSNDAGATANADGWVLASTSSSSFASPYNTTLNSNSGLVTWTFNMRQIRTDPSGFGATSYGVAFILAGTASTNNNTGSGYAVALGQSGSTDAIRLVRYTSGIQGTMTNILTSNTAGLTDFGAEYLSVKVTFNPSTNTWGLFLRNDGVSAFADPALGTLTSQGSATDNTFTSISLPIMGAWWQGSTAANQTSFFDNVRVLIGLNDVNGTISSNEYGTHTDGQNQQTNGAVVNFMNWDANNLYVGVSGANLAEGFVLYLDKDPQVPVNGGTNANGTNVGQLYDATNFADLPFRADLVLYVKNNYREYRTANGSNSWNSAVAGFGLYAESGTTREFSIPWSLIGGMPSSLNFYSYLTSSGGFVYGQVPTENAGGTIGTTARYGRYYTVSTTTIGSATPTYSRNSYVFNSSSDISSFGTITCYDFTMNTVGRLISRTGATSQNWTIGGNLVVGAGTVYFGSGGTNGAYGTTTVSGNLDVRGGTLDMDQTTSALTVNGNLTLSSGTLQLSGNAFGGGDLKLKGNWSRTSGTFTPNSRAVFLDAATGDQSVTRSGGESFDYLIIDKAAGNVVLNNDINVSNGLTLSNGKINTGANKVVQPALAAIARTNGWINGNLQRAVSNGNNNFFIGTSTVYAQATLNMTGVSGTVDITSYLTAGLHPNEGSSTIDPTKKANHYWTLTKSGLGTFTSYTSTFNVANTTNTGTVSNYKIAKFDSPSTWSSAGGITTGNDVTSASFASFSDFIAGEAALPPPTISFTGTLSALSTTYGTSSSETMFSVSGADMTAGILVTPPVGYEVSLTSSSGFGATVTVGVAGTISPTPVYVRLKADATVAGSPYSGNIVLSSAGATSVNVSTVASTVSTAALTITGITGENKVYNGNTDATFTGTATYSGLQNGEMFSVSGTPVATFAFSTAGMGITINVTGYTAPNTNYTLTLPTLSANITQKPLTINDITADNKVYDGNNSATLSGTAALVGVITADLANVTLGGTPVATFNDETVGMNKPVTVTGYNISGSASGNYSLSQPMGLTANITSAAIPVITSALTASGTYGVAISTYFIIATNSPTSYDATGLPSGLMVNMTTGAITGIPTAAPGMYNVTISATNGGGTGDAVLVFTLDPKPLTVTGATANNKIYTRTNAAFISGSVLVGVIGMDDVTITSTGTFAQVTVGIGIAVTSTQVLSGVDAGKYTVTLPTGLIANITQKELTVSGAAVNPKTYTGTNEATITGATLLGVISPDVVTVSGGGTFADVNVANGISVASALSLGGADLGNYNLTQPTLTGNITPAPLTITGITADNKIYDATDAATLTGTPDYVGLQNSEMFSVIGTPVAAFSNKTVANGKNVTVTGYTAPSSNYTATQPSLTANITPATLTVTGAMATNRVYDATTIVTVSGTLSGVLTSDIVNLGTTGTMTDANAGSGKTVTFSISGADATNYALTQPGITVNISQASQSITFGALPNKTTNDVPFNAGATSPTSGINALAYSSSLISVATINPTTGLITIAGPGITIITVSQSGDINYTAATSMQQTLTVTAAPVNIFSNTITGTNPNTSNPYTSGQTFNSNITVSGIGRGTGITGTNANDRYNANSWNTTMLDANDYFEFTLTPNAGYEIDFSSFVYTSQASGSGPTSTAFRSNIDSYTSNIGTSTISGTTISLSAGGYQNITSAITFRFYAWGGTGGTFSINDFIFNGNVNCVEPIAYNVTGGGSYCSGGAGLAVGLSNSQVGISYQLRKDNVDTGSPVAGTGAAISFGNQNATGTYTVVASNTNGSCNLTLDMTGSVMVTINPLPSAPLITATESTCQSGCALSGGSFTVSTACGVGTTLTYFIDITGTTTMSAPTYNQTTPMTIYYACVDDVTGCRSAIQSLTTVPGSCITPDAPTGSLAIINSTCIACLVSGGSIAIGTVSGTGGTLEYSTDGGTTWSSTLPSYAAPQTIIASVLGANGCRSTNTSVGTTVAGTCTTPDAPTGSLAITNSTCIACLVSGGSIAIGSVSGTGGTLEYSTDSGTTWSSTLPSYAAPQTIIASVLGANGCRSTNTSVGTTVAGTCTTPDAPTGSLAITNSTCIACLVSGGSIAIGSVSGTGGTLEYSTDGGTTWSSTLPSYAAPQTIIASVLGANGCRSTTTSVGTTVAGTCTTPDAPTGSLTITNSTCIACAVSGGSIAIGSVSGTGGTLEYSTDGGTTWSSTLPSYAAPQTIIASVLGANGCRSTTTSVGTTVAGTCTTPDAPTGSLTITNSTCIACVVSGGSIAIGSVAGTGGTLEYSTDGGTTWSSTLPSYNAPQTIIASVLGANGCRSTTTSVGATIAGTCTTLDAPTGSLAITNSTCIACVVSGGSIAIGTVSGTGGTLEYSTDGGTTWSSTLPSYNAPQTIIASVLGANGCRSTTTSVGSTVAGTCTTPDAPLVTTSAATCTNAGTATISNYDVDNMYTFDPLGPTVGAGGMISNMTAGTGYTVTATNGIGCTSAVSASFSVAVQLVGPSAPMSGSNSPICAGATLNLTSSASGSAPFTYNWTGLDGFNAMVQNPSIPAATAAASGTYSVTITNSCGNTTSDVNVIINVGPSSLNYTSNTVSYCLNTAIATNSPTFTGSPATSYSVSPALPAGLNFNTSTGEITGTPTVATAATDYTVTVANICGSTTRIVNIQVNERPTAGTCKIDDLCQTNSGTITIQASGGTAPYNVTWTPAHGTPSSGQSISLSGGTLPINGLHGGVTYIFTITDSNGCSAQ